MRGRRGRGEGSISQRRDGRWMARVDLGWHEGRRRYKAVYGHTRREVADKLTKLLRDKQQGIPLGDDRQTLRQYLDHWLAAITNSVRPKTLWSYTQLVRLHVIPGLGHVPLTKLQPEEVEAFLEVKRQAGLSPRTRQYLRAVLRIALNRAMRHGLVARNVAALAAPPRGTRPEVKSLSPEQARTFLVSIASHRLYALFAVAVSCGLRQGGDPRVVLAGRGSRSGDPSRASGARTSRKRLATRRAEVRHESTHDHVAPYRRADPACPPDPAMCATISRRCSVDGSWLRVHRAPRPTAGWVSAQRHDEAPNGGG